MKLSAIILSRTITKELFDMTNTCIRTMLDSETDVAIEVIVVESNKEYHQSGFAYAENVKVVIPDENFNFHKFFNIGIEHSKGEFIALLNNDLIFYTDWFTEILKVENDNPEILSFSPNGNAAEIQKPFQKGYKVRTHVFGWCIIAKRTVFDKIGMLDETFDFNYADNDYALTLKKYNIPHAVVYRSNVAHLDQKVVKIDKGDWYKKQQEGADVILRESNYTGNSAADKKSVVDQIKFHRKWGNPKKIYYKNKVADKLIQYNLGFLNRFILSI